MFNLRGLIAGTLRSRALLSKLQTPMHVQKLRAHDTPPQPFDNMPFTVKSRYAATIFFGLFFGAGLWAPFLIVWYSMAKSSL